MTLMDGSPLSIAFIQDVQKKLIWGLGLIDVLEAGISYTLPHALSLRMLWPHYSITRAVKIRKQVDVFTTLCDEGLFITRLFMSVDVWLFIYVFVETQVGLVLLKMN